MSNSIFQNAWALRRDAAGAIIYWLGLGRSYELLTRPTGAIILMYHSVAPEKLARLVDPPNRIAPRDFDRQMAFLSKHRQVISLTDLVSQIAAGRTPAAGTVCITFDDGYLDNLTTAAPILAKYRLPATLFLPTAYVDRGETQWADTLHRLFSQRTCDRIHLPFLGIHASLAHSDQRASARKKLHLLLLEMNYPQRSDLLQEVERQLQPSGSSARLTMNWDEVRELLHRFPLFEVGGHSRNHIDLKTHCQASSIDEIKGCAEDLQRELGLKPKHFSFPYGRWHAETRKMVLATGWCSAVGASLELRIGEASDLHVMARPATPKSMTELRFKTSGAYPGALSFLGLG